MNPITRLKLITVIFTELTVELDKVDELGTYSEVRPRLFDLQQSQTNETRYTANANLQSRRQEGTWHAGRH